MQIVFKLFFATIIFLSLFFSLHSQPVPKKVLIEEFTNASCGPCATYNPALNSLIKQNINKVVAVKFQTSSPGYDPINQLNPLDVDNREFYYSINSVPSASVNGQDDIHPFYFNQSLIDQEYDGVTTPFRITMSNELNQTSDSIIITITVSNEDTVAVTAGGNNSLKLRVILIEDLVKFPEAPGSNGETEFEWVMRDMYPSSSGYILTNTWMPGQTETFVYRQALPSFIYGYDQLSTVAFIQDDHDKFVYQAEKTDPVVLGDGFADAYIKLTNLNDHNLCNLSFDPTFEIVNQGPDTLKGFLLNVERNGTLIYSMPWTGELFANDTVVIVGDSIFVDGEIEVNAYISDYADNVLELNLIDNEYSFRMNSVNENSLNYNQDFEDVVPGELLTDMHLLPERKLSTLIGNAQYFWGVDDPMGGFGNSDYCILWAPTAITIGDSAGVMTNLIDLTTATEASLSFSMAFAQKNFSLDQFLVLASSDCGETWDELFNKLGPNLATATTSEFLFYPKSDEWARHTIDLNDYLGEKVVFKFIFIARNGHHFFIDDITIEGEDSNVGITDLELDEQMTVSPNPFQGYTNLNISLDRAENLHVQVIDLMGKVVFQQELEHLGGRSELRLNGTGWAKGVYHVVVTSSRGRVNRKVLLR